MRVPTTLYFLLMIVVSPIYADGIFVWDKGADLYEPSQKALIYWADDTEKMILQVKYFGQAEDFAWIVPLPAEPEIEAVDTYMDPFEELSLFTQLRQRIGYRGLGNDMNKGVSLLQRKTVGIYDVAVLASANKNALAEWLEANGYKFPQEKADILDYYTQKNWFFVAMKIDSTALQSDQVKNIKHGQLQSVSFTFDSPEMVYPLKISSGNAGETELLLYLLSEKPMAHESVYSDGGFSMDANLVDNVIGAYFFDQDAVHSSCATYFEYGTYYKVGQKNLPLTWGVLGIDRDKKLSLCQLRRTYTPETMTEDLVFHSFSPLRYWSNYLSLEPIKATEKEGYEAELVRRNACIIFGYYDSAFLNLLASSQYVENRKIAAWHPETTAEVIVKLARDPNCRIKDEIIDRHDNLPAEAIRILSEDESVISSLSDRDDIPVNILENLLKDERYYFRRAAMRNKNTTLKLLRPLLDNPDADIRIVLARMDIPDKWIEKLSEDKEPSVRSAVVRRHLTPAHILEKLSKDKVERVRVGVARHWRFPNLPEDMIERLAKDESELVREAVAGRDNIPEHICEMLLKDRSERVQKTFRQRHSRWILERE